MVRDESLSRSFMVLAVGTATLLLSAQWGSFPSVTASQLKLPIVNLGKSPVAKAPSEISNLQTQLVVDLSDRRVYVYHQRQRQASYPLAVGQAGWETPTGSFQVMQMDRDPVWQHPITEAIIPPGPDNPLGTRWIAFWSDGQHQIGFHGTDQEEFIGQAISHGCLRMRNQDIEALYEKVSRGTPVIVRP